MPLEARFESRDPKFPIFILSAVIERPIIGAYLAIRGLLFVTLLNGIMQYKYNAIVSCSIVQLFLIIWGLLR